MKTCTKCNQTKSISDFSKNKRIKDGLSYYCKTCFSSINRQVYLNNSEKKKAHSKARYAANKDACIALTMKWIKNNPRRAKNNSLLKDHGITIEQYEMLFQKQDGKCAICLKHQTELRIRLAVDHCHKTNKIRGLLCDTCNRGIGFLKEDKEILTKAINYLDGDRVLNMELNHVR